MFSDEETARLTELVASLKTSTRDVTLVIADYDENGDTRLTMLATHENPEDAVDNLIDVVEIELGIDDSDDDGDQPELPFVEKATLQ